MGSGLRVTFQGALAVLAIAAAAPPAAAGDTTPIDCGACEKWNASITPFRIHQGVYYVGTRGLSSLLVDTGAGLLLLDAALPQSAERIVANIRTLGFEPRDVRWIVNSHEHYDHAGGIAAVARLTGARVAASPRGAAALRTGSAAPDDPQAGFGDAMRFPPVREVRAMSAGEAIKLGRVALVARHTPGHTPGATSWTWRSCTDTGKDCLDFVYADSLNPVSAPGFRYTDDAALKQVFDASVTTFKSLACDALVPVHPEFASAQGSPADFIGRDKCSAYAARVESRWRQRQLDEESGPTRP